MPKTVGPHNTRNEIGHVGTPAFTKWLTACVSAYSRNPWDNAVLADLRHARSMLARFFLNTPEETLKSTFSNELAKLHLSIAGGGLRDLPLSEEEQQTFDQALSAFRGDTKQYVPPGHILAAMLYCRPDDRTAAFLVRDIPDWLYGVFIAFLVMEPMFFDEATAFRSYCEFAKRVVRYTHGIVTEGSDTASEMGPRARIAAHSFTIFSRPIQPYFGDGDLRDVSEHRACIIEKNARAAGLKLDWIFEPRTAARAKIRVGILMPHFASKTETFATLPVFEHLDRGVFEIYLYAIEAAGTDLERYCASRADRISVLSRNPAERASTIRNDKLDILFFGSNLTAGADECATLALHRLAPVQVASICCPVTTGLPNMDYYIAGDLLAPADKMQNQFREKLVNVAGSGLCFSYGPENSRITQPVNRARLGIPDDAILFISGANYFKITPEVRQTWATIISRVPGSVLALYPFNPNWSSRYDYEPFINDIKKHFAQRGLAEQQLKILKPLPGRADIKALLALADVYLDSFPYGGATSLIDTLEAGLPPVVFKGDVLRFRQAAAMIEELPVSGLVAATKVAYEELAISLGTDVGLRHRLRDEIRARMQASPSFLDSRGYGLKIAKLFQSLHERHPN